ncbi:HK97-gp10 family putative phage morphogenesis protein, partial [Enterobacter hormaechei]|uniref:HK97-gp10 family putative phage morphogenesis protein n=1 Tax=Enterobacter hormaechei TaxID=158836 RepID=UPI00299F8671
ELTKDSLGRYIPVSYTHLDNTMKANNPRNAFYWRFVEMGTANMPPHPFIRPAFDVRQEQATEVAIRRMNQAIDEALSK